MSHGYVTRAIIYVENGWSFKILVKMDHKWFSLGRFGPNFWLLADLLALVGSYRTSEITKGTIPCSFLVSSCLKSLHSQTPNPFIPLGNMYSLFCGWRINTGGQRDETGYGKINCFFIADEPFLMMQFVFIGASRDPRDEKLVCVDQEIWSGPRNRTGADQRNFGNGPDMDNENFEIHGPDPTWTKKFSRPADRIEREPRKIFCRLVDPWDSRLGASLFSEMKSQRLEPGQSLVFG